MIWRKTYLDLVIQFSSFEYNNFLRKPENLTQHYHRLTGGIVEEVSFAGAVERVTVSLNLGEKKTITVTRPKTETTAFPLVVGQSVIAGLVRYRVLER